MTQQNRRGYNAPNGSRNARNHQQYNDQSSYQGRSAYGQNRNDQDDWDEFEGNYHNNYRAYDQQNQGYNDRSDYGDRNDYNGNRNYNQYGQNYNQFEDDFDHDFDNQAGYREDRPDRQDIDAYGNQSQRNIPLRGEYRGEYGREQYDNNYRNEPRRQNRQQGNAPFTGDRNRRQHNGQREEFGYGQQGNNGYRQQQGNAYRQQQEHQDYSDSQHYNRRHLGSRTEEFNNADNFRGNRRRGGYGSRYDQ
ncbi:MAG: hypothetical protein BGO31_12060 [Bacteroidetes bacterium 43-16]|nr:MAG: hypothetical protein BGO31_12060 [Bacteroidetes bacterium 43-16]